MHGMRRHGKAQAHIGAARAFEIARAQDEVINTAVWFCRHRGKMILSRRSHKKGKHAMEKQVVRANVPETGGPFNMAVTYGNMIYISGLPPFTETYSRQMREARAKGEKLPP